jgi:hypothetical protein
MIVPDLIAAADVAALGPLEPGDDAQQRGLAAATGTEQRRDPAERQRLAELELKVGSAQSEAQIQHVSRHDVCR